MEDSERRKAIELLKEMRAGGTEEGKLYNQEDRLNWMYKGPSDLIDKEEYLLGKAIDKTFEALNNAGSSDVVGRTGEQSNIPKRLLEKTDSTEQVDIAKKILEDPLYAIKQKEMEARKKLLNNPVKLKQIKQMLLERSKQNNAHKQKKKKTKKNSEAKLNLLIIKKLKKFTDKQKRKALNKVLQSDSDSSSTSSSSSSGREQRKHKSRRKRTHSVSNESESSSETTSSSECEKTKKNRSKKRKDEPDKKKHNKKSKESSSDSDSSSSERSKEAKSKKSKSKKHSKKVSCSSSCESSESSSGSEKTRKAKKASKSKHEKRNSKFKSKRKSSIDRDEENRKAGKRDISSANDRRVKKNYGLMVLEGSKPAVKTQPVPKYEKTTETKAKYVPPAKAKPLSDKEREEKLREMMEDAKLRKRDRENNLASHRKKQAQEEESKDYDEDFIRRQMKHLTSQGTMADRIKSNVNNIQRSKSSMDSSFMRK